MDKVSVVVVLDESGSMEPYSNDTVGGYNKYIKGLKERRDIAIDVSLMAFSSYNTRWIYTRKPLDEVPDLTRDTYIPGGSTPLYDAIGSAIRWVREQKDITGTPVLFVTITDGEENHSLEYRLDSIKASISELEDLGWTFVYLGANQDAWQVGGSYGYQRSNIQPFDTRNMEVMYNHLHIGTHNYLSAAQSANTARGTVSNNFFSGAQYAAEVPQIGPLAGPGDSPVQKPKKQRKNKATRGGTQSE